MQPLLIDGMKGLGDNIYQRGFLNSLSKTRNIYLETPWPELYSDLNIKCVRRDTPLRTQQKNINIVPSSTWWIPPKKAERIKIHYNGFNHNRNSIISEMSKLFKCKPSFDLPDFGESKYKGNKKIALIRPVTARKEWHNLSRNPKAEYIRKASELLYQDYTVISVADLEHGKEWIEGIEPKAHIKLHKGELNVSQLLALVQASDIVVGGVGWIVPAAIAMQKKAFFVLGGNGGYNAPEKITDSTMDLSNIAWAMPDNYCRCIDMRHSCKKTISNFDRKFYEWLDGI